MENNRVSDGDVEMKIDGEVEIQRHEASAVHLSVHSNPIVNNIGPENTNRCDAASAIEGCSEVSEPNSLQTDT
ncbi:hypothetical protein Bca4012_009952 [Brassica carinata]